MAKKFAFALKEKIVYPGQGVGEVVEIDKKKFKDTILNYYVIYLEESDMTVLIPVDKAQELGLRTIISKKEAEKALAFLSEEFEPIPSDWKMRYQMNLDLFKSGNIFDNASIVRSLYHRSKVKELPVQEKKLYDSAYRIFEDEISSALKLSKTEIEKLIHARLEPLIDEEKLASKLLVMDIEEDDLPNDILDIGADDDDEDFDDE